MKSHATALATSFSHLYGPLMSMIFGANIQKNMKIMISMSIFLFGLIAVASAEASGSDRSPLGINISLNRYYSPQIAFVDVFKQAKEWKSDDTLDQDENGWVRSLKTGQTASTVIFNAIDGNYPGGQYVCLYDGEGSIQFSRDASVVSRETGRIVLDVTPSDSGIFIELTSTNSADPIKNIRVVMPGHEATYQSEPFNPEFIDRLKGYEVLRFMRWGVNNTSYYTGWSGRATPEYYSQGTDKQVAIEWMIRLANKTKTNPWFSVPYKADAEYMQKFAELVRDTLDPSLIAYLEFTNEVWNCSFPQCNYAIEQGQAQSLSDNKYTGRLLWYSQEATKLFKIWENVLGDERVVNVIGGMAANAWNAQKILEHGEMTKYAEAIAIAPYIGGRLGKVGYAEDSVEMTEAQLLSAVDEDIARVMSDVESNKVVADKFGVDLIAYEGGQHLAPAAKYRDALPELTRKFIAVNRDPKIKDVYLKYLTEWQTITGNRLFVMFDNVAVYSKYGSWGIQEYQDQPISDAPKAQAVLEYMGIGYADKEQPVQIEEPVEIPEDQIPEDIEADPIKELLENASLNTGALTCKLTCEAQQ